MQSDEFKSNMDGFRSQIATLCTTVSAVKLAVAAVDPVEGQDKGEMLANIMLAFRALEDAAMRFGKAIQASSGGVSPLGGPNTPGK